MTHWIFGIFGEPTPKLLSVEICNVFDCCVVSFLGIHILHPVLFFKLFYIIIICVTLELVFHLFFKILRYLNEFFSCNSFFIVDIRDSLTQILKNLFSRREFLRWSKIKAKLRFKWIRRYYFNTAIVSCSIFIELFDVFQWVFKFFLRRMILNHLFYLGKVCIQSLFF